jgi:rSAM/selenodomain-associated transferase 1
MNKNALIIFVRNPILGKVKTRLAATIGDEKALQVYVHLLQHTKSITENVPATKFVFYADDINDNDIWNAYQKKLQNGNDLGERMQNAFEEVFTLGYKNVCIIGSDCYELTQEIIDNAFEDLVSKDAVIGGANDGGYYLLGMNQLINDIFTSIEWSTTTVFNKTIALIEKQNLLYSKLPFLNDVDEEKDITFTY